MKKVSKVIEVVEMLRDGKIVVFPTDTVWGVGAKASDKEAIKRLYKLKKRDSSKPTAVLVSSLEVAEKLGVFSEKMFELTEKYWPGSLTVIVEVRENVPSFLTAGGRSVGIRVPDGIVHEILEKLGEGVIATSANFAGESAPQSYEELNPEFLDAVDAVFVPEKEGDSSGVSSTVIRASGDGFEVLRQGDIKL